MLHKFQRFRNTVYSRPSAGFYNTVKYCCRYFFSCLHILFLASSSLTSSTFILSSQLLTRCFHFVVKTTNKIPWNTVDMIFFLDSFDMQILQLLFLPYLFKSNANEDDSSTSQVITREWRLPLLHSFVSLLIATWCHCLQTIDKPSFRQNHNSFAANRFSVFSNVVAVAEKK